MKICELKLNNYRNIKEAKLNLDSKKIIIIGKNAQGKTNILESVYLISCLKSQRTSNNIELINLEENFLDVSVVIEKNNTKIDLKYKYKKDKKREIKINGLKTNKIKDFKNVLKCVLFSTQDLLLLRGVPQDRRDWLDVAISQVYPAFEERLSKYAKIRIQKNNFLKDYNGNDTLLEVYNEQLAILGSNIIYLRKKFLKELEKIAQKKHSKISEEEKLSLFYKCKFLDEKDLEIEEISQKFKKTLEEHKKEEIRRGQALVGPHRDDIMFCINNQESTKYASQGQQRTIVLSLKLAELNLIKDKTGEAPILLLDDVLAELDDLRQNYLLTTIDENTQTIITSVDTLLFDEKFLKDVNIFRVEKGKVFKN